ncbi:hypothetical protein [uncultured Halomonas sp.]|uniref:hypothetical protein n=1 Tax=uncultured Halomonas sp. TaxID=173971 RepID=UPI002631A4D3|nr:hypothetical protein [uncultured Halomonas sp.]
MALSKPTNLQVQTLEPLVGVAQSVERYVAAGPLVPVHQYIDDTASLAPAVRIGITQLVDDSAVIRPAGTLVGVTQLVDDSATLRPAATLATLEQEVVTYSDQPASTLVAINQAVERHASAQALVSLRQVVHSVAQAAEITTLILLDGQDITARCAPAFDVQASEGDNRTAQIIYRPPSGPISITGYQGRPVEIQRKIAGTWVTLFTGWVDVPTYRRDTRTLQLACSDLRSERLGRESRDRLKRLTGGVYSNIAQREDAEGEQWVRELLKTVEGSLDYTGSGSLRYRPWAIGTPRYTLTADKIHHREINLEFATRSEIVNRVTGVLEYRYYRRNTFEHSVTLGMRRSYNGAIGSQTGQLPHPGAKIPSRSDMRAAAEGVSGWHLVSFVVSGLPPNGWYKTGVKPSDKTSWYANEGARANYGMGFSATIARYISQPKRERYEIKVEAPESIDQFGEIAGSAMRLAAETRVDPSIFEERGCVIVANPDDRRGDVDQAITAMQRMAAKEIRSGHRKNHASFRYKPRGGDLLPVEIGDTIAVSNSEISATGYVTELRHVVTAHGDRYTDVRLSISRVDSSQSVSEDWSLPAPPSGYRLTPAPDNQLETPSCPIPEVEGQDTEQGESRIEDNGSVYVVAPSIGREHVDEIIGTRKHTYPVKIPRNQFEVEVP